jgi:hypothetical protein
MGKAHHTAIHLYLLRKLFFPFFIKTHKAEKKASRGTVQGREHAH